MQTTSMSITRALATLKAQKEEIATFFAAKHVFAAVSSGASGIQTSIAGQTVEQMKAMIQGNKDRIDGLIKRQTKIKHAINVSNMNTNVSVNGVTMTVAEAVVMKGTLPYRVTLLQTLRESLQRSRAEFDQVKAGVDKRIDAIVAASVNDQTDAADKAELSGKVRQVQEKQLAPTLIDPLDLAKQIADLDAEIIFLRNELDYTLSTSNTNTMIQVEM